MEMMNTDEGEDTRVYVCTNIKSLPHGADGVWLGQLDDDGSRAQLVAGVARVPVVVAGVPVQ